MTVFKPRLTDPSKDDKNYIHYTKGGYNTCILITSNSVLPNCVGYAQGRLLELTNATKPNWKLPACNAEDWYEQAKKNGMQTGATPKLGAVICWKSGALHNSKDGSGHIAIVEDIKSNGDLIISQSAYGGARFSVGSVTKTSGYKYDTSKQFIGFIYCGIDFEEPKPIDDKYYHVQVGAYAKKENAEKLQKELISKGYNAIIKYY